MLDGARVEFCSDRACSSSIATVDSAGSSAKPSSNLPTGVVFWRLHGKLGGGVGVAVSPTWQFTVLAHDTPVDTSWGTVLDVNGDGYGDVIAGAPGANGNAGRAHIFMGGASGLRPSPSPSLDAPVAGSFGACVVSAGDVNGDGFADVLVGARAPGISASDIGSAYLYLGGPGGVSPSPVSTLVGPDGAGSRFGHSLACAGDVNGDGYADVAVGAPGVASSAGAVYFYLGGPNGLSSSATTSFSGPANGYFGDAVASAGDLNGDGYEDFVVGADFPLSASEGFAYVYLGGPTGLQTSPQTLSVSVGFGLGNALAGGDFNGDGYADLVVAQHRYARVNVYWGSASGIGDTPSVQIDGLLGFGQSVASAGDVDGNGYADLLVGDPEVTGPLGAPIGATFVYFGASPPPFPSPSPSPSPFATRKVLFPPGGASGAYFGNSVAGAGDVNGDGYADVCIGAPLEESQGVIYIFRGKAGSINTSWNPAIVAPDGTNSEFGLWCE
jgi:hypothetical protein